MATTIAFKVEVDAGKSVKDLTEVEKQLEGVNEKVSSGNVGFRESAKLIKEYQDIALKAGRESPVGQEAIRRAAQLKDQLGDLRNEVTRLSKDGQALQGALALGETVTAGYGAFQGVIALVGDENEKLLETIAKLQAAQSILTGIERVRLSLEKESVLMLQARVLWTKAVTLAQGGLTKALGLSTAAARGFAAALAATGIGAIIAGIALLVANFDKLTDAIGLTNKAQREADEQFLKNSEKRKVAIQEQIALEVERLDLAIREARLRGVAEDEISKMLLNRTELQKRAIREEMKAVEQLIAQQNKAFRAAQKANDISGAVQIIDKIKELTGEYDKLDLKLQAVDITVRESNKKGFEEALALEKKLTAEKQKEYEARAAKLAAAKQKELELELKFQQDLEDILTASIEDDDVRRLAQLEIAHEREKARLIAQYGERTELMKALELQQSMEMAAAIEEIETAARETKAEIDEERRLIEQEAAIEAFNQELIIYRDNKMILQAIEDEFLEYKRDNGIIKESEYLAEKARLQDQEVEMTQKATAAMNAARATTVTAAASALGAIGALFKKGSKEAKAFAIAQLAINTAQSIGSVIAGATSAAAAGGPAAPFLLAAYIASGLATVLTSIGQAKSILGDSSSTPSPSVSSASVAAPVMPNQTSAGGIGTSTEGAVQQQQQMQVVVLASEVSDVNQQNASIELASVF